MNYPTPEFACTKNVLNVHPVSAGSQQPTTWGKLYGSSLGLAIVELQARSDSLVVAITEDAQSAQRLLSQARFYAESRETVSIFPDWECLPYDHFSPHADIVSERLAVLKHLPRLSSGIVILPVTNLMQRLAPREYVESTGFIIARGDTIDISQLRRRLEELSYHSVSQVLEPGEFCVRGGLIDIFPTGSTRPFRVDLFDNEVDTIRYFHPDTQRTDQPVNEINLLPGREMPLDSEGVKRFRSSFRARFTRDPNRSEVYRDVSNGLAPSGIEFYLPLFFEHTDTFFDYLPENSVLVYPDTLTTALSRAEVEVRDRYQLASADSNRPVLPPGDLYLDEKQTKKAMARIPQVRVATFSGDLSGGNSHAFSTRSLPEFQVLTHSDHPYEPFLNFLRNTKDRCLLVAESPGRREVLKSLLRDNDVTTKLYEDWKSFLVDDFPLGLTVADLEQGLRLTDPAISVITESQLYGDKVLQRRRRSKASKDPESVIRSLEELNEGEPVVHEEHGVGRFRGLKKLTTNGIETEFLVLEYQDGDKLYIPILCLSVVGRFIGGSPETAPLHKLGGEQWIRAKRRAREKAYDVATELLEVQALRMARKGYSFAQPDDSYNAFTASFPFEETPDQLQGITDILGDMTSDKPMDRLICGDVGFGKTEIALRAAFLAVYSGKQVAVLVPTTLLAQQHYQNFSDRFADFPVRTALLSRFRTAKQQQESIEQITRGEIDVVVGTHRLLQSDLKFKDLGLIIIDEEHRFGVRQKDLLKRVRSQADVLTLTATPIPRTLNTSLSGLKDISVIATPPRARLSIKTFVREWNEAAIREACLREIRRGGQVYFLHNEVKTIGNQLQILADLVPEAKIRIAHGQLAERDLEAVMTDFYHQRFNILLCSTIIESGIDIPTANTIIINRADRFGLAQLHQLRGRVGRSHHQAYAYLLTPPRKVLTGDALKRLQAIEALEDLGAGFALASHDLEIRGAGELLGEAQSGTIDEIGFSMYSRFLENAIRSIQQERSGTPSSSPVSSNTEINLHSPALFPDDYLHDVHQRLVMYKRISTIRAQEELDDIRAEAIDRFGPLPESAATLFTLAEFRLTTSKMGISNADIGARGGRITFEPTAPIDPAKLIELLESSPGSYQMKGPQTLVIKEDLPEARQRVQLLKFVIESLRDDTGAS